MTTQSADGGSVSAPTPERLAWVDATRGFCVAGVVLFHVSLWWFLPEVAGTGTVADRLWTTVNNALGSVRMPLLLAVSGLVAARRIRLGLGDAHLRARATANAYLYAVWVGVYALFYAFVPDDDLPHRIDGPLQAVTELVVPSTTLWYLWALPVYALGLAAVRRAPAYLVLLVLAVVSVGARVLLDGPGMWPRVIELAFFFALGVYGAPALRAFAARVNGWLLTGCVVVGLLTGLAERASDADLYGAAYYLLRGAVFLLLCVAGVVIVIRWQPIRRAAQMVGRRTLPVYVMHVPLIVVLILLTRAVDVHAAPVVALAIPVAATIGIIAACLALERVLMAAGAGALFRMPRRSVIAGSAP